MSQNSASTGRSAAPTNAVGRAFAFLAACGVGLAGTAFMGSSGQGEAPPRERVASISPEAFTPVLDRTGDRFAAAPAGETRRAQPVTTRQDAMQDNRLQIAGSSWMCERMQTEVGDQVVLRKTRGRAAIDLVTAGSVDAALFTGEVSKRELERGLQTVRVADRIFVLAVGPECRVRNISSDMVDDALSGRLKNWIPLGGKRQPFELVAAVDQRQTELFARVLMPGDRVHRDATKVVGRDALRQVIARSNGNALGVGGLVDLGGLDSIHLLRIDGVLPTVESYSMGNYPFGRKVNLVTRDAEVARRVSNWLASEEGQAALWTCCVPAAPSQR